VTLLTVGCAIDPQNAGLAGNLRKHGLLMTTIQLVIGTALGFVLAQIGLSSARGVLNWLRHEEVRARLRHLTPALGPAMIGGFIKYAGPLGAGAALVALGVWAVGDYWRANSARSAALASAFEHPAAALPAPAPDSPNAADKVAALVPPPTADLLPVAPVAKVDPYADPDFKVQRRAHHGSKSLRETLVRRAETKARTELLTETHQHALRSQYDCEAAERAVKYLKSGLDVWGFAAWQVKYFPMDGYKGATLARCKELKNVLDPASLNLQAAVTRSDHS
jgi:hypothetical protein